MKLVTLFSVLALATVMIVGPSFSLEAKHHHSRHHHSRNYFSLNVGPVVSSPGYVVERYPTVVQQYTYVDPWGMPYREAVFVQPAPRVVYPVYPRPAVSFGVGMMFR